jgi:hypothetical protein
LGEAALADIIYTTVPGKIGSLLNKIKDVGVPSKVTHAWLKAVGFSSSNDPSLIGVLKLVGLIDSSGTPTPSWQGFRGPKGKAILGEGIKAGYSELYSVYPDAHDRSNNELEQVFSMNTKAGKQAISKIVSTFKNLAAEAEFVQLAASDELHVETGPLHAPVTEQKKAPVPTKTQGGFAPSLHIDMQIHISPDASADQIDQIFASMAKHLYGSK